MAEPVFEAYCADARVIAGDERPVVQLRAEIERMRIRRAPFADRWSSFRNRATSSLMRTGSGPAISITLLIGGESATSAMMSATSSDAIG